MGRDHGGRGDEDAEEVAEAARPNAEEDIREQREMIAKLKAERDASTTTTTMKKRKNGGVVVAADIEMVVDETAAQKRTREEEDGPAYQFNFREGGEVVEQRAIATNRRVRTVLGEMGPERKSIAWGALAFAAGLGAV